MCGPLRRPVFVASLLVLVPCVAAASDPAALIARDAAGRAVPMPLRHTEVAVDIAAHVAAVDVTQVFENGYDRPVEAVYVFPLPDTAAVSEMVVETGGRTIRGTVRTREDAEALYQAARREGRVAALLQEQRPNVFTQRIAHLQPGAEVVVRIHYVERLRYASGRYTLLFPMVVAERYTPAHEGVDEEPLLHPAYAAGGERPAQDIALTVTLDAGVPVADVVSTSHAIEVELPAPERAIVRLAAGDTIPNKDFVLEYTVAGDAPRVAVLAHREDGDGHFLLLLQPETQPDDADIANKELIFVLDVSGSMDGPPLAMVQRLAMAALGRLDPGDTFDVVDFADTPNVYADTPVEATAGAIAAGQKHVRRLRTRGGTELLAGLRAATRIPHDGRRARVIVLMTDAEVGNDDEILTIAHELGKVRLFVVGVGTAVNHSLGRRLSAAGRGTYQHLRPDAAGIREVDQLIRTLEQPCLTNLSIDWGSLRVADLQPRTLPDVFAGQPLLLAGRYAWGGSDTVIVRGTRRGVPWEQRVAVTLPERETAHAALGPLWARLVVDDLEMAAALATSPAERTAMNDRIRALALEHHLLTRFTSLVAVDEVVSSPSSDADLESVLQQVPRPDMVQECVVFGRTKVVELDAEAQAVTIEAVEGLPVFGRDYQAAMRLAPGVADVRGDGNPNVFGARDRDFRTTVDGVSAIDPLSGRSLDGINPDAIEEIAITTVGPDSSYGGAARVVTKSGGNGASGTFSLVARAGAGRGAATGYEPRAVLSGPIVRDRLWYLVSADGAVDRQRTLLPGAAAVDGTRRGLTGLGKLTWQITPKHRLALEVLGDRRTIDPYGIDSATSRASGARLDDHGPSAVLKWTAALRPDLFFAVDASAAERDETIAPVDPAALNDCAAGAWGSAVCLDLASSERSGAYGRTSRTRTRTRTGRVEAEKFVDRWLGGQHVFTVRLELERAQARRDVAARPWLALLAPNPANDPDAPRAAVGADPLSGGYAAIGRTRTAVRLQDRYEPHENVTVTLTLDVARERFDRSAGASSAAGPRGADAVSPGAMLAWDPLGDSKTKVSVSWRRTAAEIGLAPLLRAADPAYALRGGTVSTGVVEAAGGGTTYEPRVDAALAPARGSEWCVSGEREIAPETSLELSYTQRDDTHLPAIVDLLEAGRRVVLVTDGPTGRSRRWALALTRRLWRGWYVNASYAHAQRTTSGADPAERFELPGLSWTDAPGAAALDPRHTLKVFGEVTVRDRDRLRIGGVVVAESGIPYSTVEIRQDTGAPGVPGLRASYPSGLRNDRRNRATWRADLVVRREFVHLRSARDGAVEGELAVVNAFDNSELRVLRVERSVADDGSVRDVPVAFRLPGRRVQAGVKLRF